MRLILITVGTVAALIVLFPTLQQFLPGLLSSSREISVPPSSQESTERSLTLRTVLGFDGVKAILEPEFVIAVAAEEWMRPDEQVLGLSIDGEHRTYPIALLSRHEIVNDTAGGDPVAITW